MLTKKLNLYQKISKGFFNDIYGNPFDLTLGQSEIFKYVYEPEFTRVAITTVTQYGKSDVTAQALLLACVSRVEKVIIIGPSAEQAGIIMNYVIQHVFDNPLFTSMIVYEGSLERLKKETSKTRITFRNGSEIRIITADVRTLKKEGKSLMGFGASIVVVDESCLVPDNIYSKILRMVLTQKTGKIIKLANPFEKNHFYKSFISPRYVKVHVDWRQAVAEGRLTEAGVAEAREEMPPLDFMIFYEVQFPEGGAEDSLIPLDWIEMAVVQKGISGEKRQAGLDVARFGRDKSVFICREGRKVIAMEEVQEMDTMSVSGWAAGLIEKYKPEITAVDVIGIGSGVYDRLSELGHNVAPVNVGESPSSEENKRKFHNLRAEIFWHLREMFRPEEKDGKRISFIQIPDDPDLKRQLPEIRYKYSSERKIRLEDKDDMKSRLGASPDKADALALAFMDNLTVAEPELMIY